MNDLEALSLRAAKLTSVRLRIFGGTLIESILLRPERQPDVMTIAVAAGRS
jgi:hypothetical protein